MKRMIPWFPLVVAALWVLLVAMTITDMARFSAAAGAPAARATLKAQSQARKVCAGPNGAC
jgi:hypothetical protein